MEDVCGCGLLAWAPELGDGATGGAAGSATYRWEEEKGLCATDWRARGRSRRTSRVCSDTNEVQMWA